LRKLTFLLFLSCVLSDLICQYKAPILTCITRKTAGGASNEIEWKDPNETCGAFQKFEIYSATNKNGPYTLLTTINLITTTTYNHTGINSSNTYYYYMTSTYNCAGASNFSDTLSDTLMPYPALLAISIENNFPVYKWKPVLDQKKIWAYVLINFGSSFVDTVIGREKTEYIDSSFQASSGVYTGHMVGSLSACGEKGLSPPIFRHRPVFLSLVSNPCEDEVELSWTKYQGWGPNDEVKAYEVFVTKNNGPEELVGTNDSSSRTFRYKDFLFGDTLCIRIKAYHLTDMGIHSFSNQLCFVSSKSQVPTVLQAMSASYIDNYKTKVRWYCSPDAIPKSFDLLVIDPRSNGVIRTLEKVNYVKDGIGYYSFLDSFGESKKSVAYRVRYEDLCNNKSEGGQVITNYTTINQIGLYKNEIKWPRSYFHDTVLYSKLKYELYFSTSGGGFTKIAEPTIADARFEHNVEDYYQTEGKFCYKLIVSYKFDTMKPINDSLLAMASPTQCIDMRTVLWMPNAFKINGVTPVFKPKMYFFNSNVFSMKIFNRWGRQIFETNDPGQGWNGTMDNGQLASEDSYVYLVSYVGNDGVSVEKTGTFTLIK
jgi:gliding motility-associated-like protein